MLNELNVQSVRLANTQPFGSAQELNRLLPAGRETSGWVRSVSENSAQGGGFRIQVEVSGRMIELVSNRPLPEGSQLQLSRDASGSLRASLNALPGEAPPAPASTTPAAARATAEGFLLRITGNIPAQLNNLPNNSALPGLLVTPQAAQALISQALQNPASAYPAGQNSAAPNPGAPTSGINTPSTANLSTGNLSTSNPNPTNPAPLNSALQSVATPSTPGQGLASGVGPAQQSTRVSVAMNTPTASNTASANTVATEGRGTTSGAMPTSATSPNPSATAANPVSQSNAPQAAAAGTNTTSGTANPSLSRAESGITSPSASTQTGADAVRPTPAATSAESALRSTPSGSAPQTSAPATQTAPANSATSTVATAAETSSTARGVQSTAANTATLRSEPLQTPPPPAALSALTPTNARPQGFPIHVLVNGQVIEFISPRPLQAGQQVQISRTETGQFQLSIMPPAPPLTQAYQAQVAMQQALRELLPIQIPLADGLNQLQQLSSRADSSRNSALNQMVESMLRLFSVKPGSQDAPAAIARNLQQGGLLSETRLMQNPGKLDKPDLKQQLGQLLKIGDQLPSVAREELNQLVRALLARSTAAQISSLQRWRELPDGGQERHYRLDLPIQQGNHLENAELRITEERHRDEQGQSVTLWHVRLHFELEEQGSLDAEVSLKAEWELTARFWAEHAPTLALIRERLQTFSQELTDKGFKIELMHAHLGKRQQPDLLPLNKRLVDLHT